MSTIHIDIETIPSQNPEFYLACLDSIKAPGNYKNQESINKWLDENRVIEADKLHRKTSFDGLHGEIISIAFALDDGDVIVVHRGEHANERDLLDNFFSHLAALKDTRGNRAAITQWSGHYISGFDLRFIWQRCVINKVKPLIGIPYDAKPWDGKIFDTKVAWTGVGQYSGQGSLDALSRAFGLDGKGDIDGSKVYDYWLAGRIDDIAQYNKQDVVKCRELYKRMNFIDG